jgi:hypothetical protein
MRILLTLFLSICGFNIWAQETSEMFSSNSKQIGASITDMTSASAYGAQIHLRYGHFILNKIQLGLDLNSGARDYNVFYASTGPFVKYHLTNNWFSPFATVGSDFGICDYTDRRSAHYMSGVLTWNKYFFGAGIGMYGLKQHWGFETTLGYQQEYYVRKDVGLPTDRTQQWTIPIRWRITYSF